MITISIILKATHRPDRGQYGACTRCQHGDASGQHCQHPYAGAHGLPSATMRSQEGECRDGNLQDYQPIGGHHPAQSALSF